MEKYIYDNTNGLWYELNGNYYIPCLTIPEAKQLLIGVWGRKHLQYIKEYQAMIYNDLSLSGKLYSYLAEIDTQATYRLDTLIKQLAEVQGINEQLKAQDQMAWVCALNNIRNAAEEISNEELIFSK